jgi:hypothetical protein
MSKVIKKVVGAVMSIFSSPPDAPMPDKAPMAMPDQEEQKRLARRNAAKRRGGRTSTVLTGGEETLG